MSASQDAVNAGLADLSSGVTELKRVLTNGFRDQASLVQSLDDQIATLKAQNIDVAGATSTIAQLKGTITGMTAAIENLDPGAATDTPPVDTTPVDPNAPPA